MVRLSLEEENDEGFPTARSVVKDGLLIMNGEITQRKGDLTQKLLLSLKAFNLRLN